MIHLLHRSQILPISTEESWTFFSDPKNLAAITPDLMNFKITGGAERSIYPGQIVSYTVRPFAGMKMNWVTEITHVKEKKYFVDEQRFGPYSFWHHKHFFNPVRNGIEIEDIIHYKLPYGTFGNLFHSIIAKQLKEIFDYRKEKLNEIFGKL